LVMLTILYFVCGQKHDWSLLQVPVLLILMYVFWFFFSVLMSPLCVMSKDMKNLMGVLSTPFFWLSGVIFNLRDISFDWIQTILYFNPITFFVTAFRDALYYKTWIWEDPMLCLGFAIVFIVTAMAALFVYAKTNEKVADVF
ncbi:MAG: ABC transporter permease, partial [Eggerthellaceae bacterium]|nr:ABC transporter permease [Eggerthellaceae bacterium]